MTLSVSAADQQAMMQFRPGAFHQQPVRQAREFDRRKADRENAARPGYSEHRINTRGVGLVRPSAALEFHVPFLEEPHFTTGSALVNNPKPLVWLDPYSTMGVRMWVRNGKGHWTGAHIYIKVNIDPNVPGGPGTDAYPDVTMVHFCTFSGLAFKDLGSALTDQAANLQPRLPGFGSNQ